jgi:hypothetical protein
VGAVTSYQFTNVIASHAIVAVFAIKQYLLTLTSMNGTVAKNPNQTSYDSNSIATLTAAANTGYRFIGWSGDTREQRTR